MRIDRPIALNVVTGRPIMLYTFPGVGGSVVSSVNRHPDCVTETRALDVECTVGHDHSGECGVTIAVTKIACNTESISPTSNATPIAKATIQRALSM